MLLLLHHRHHHPKGGAAVHNHRFGYYCCGRRPGHWDESESVRERERDSFLLLRLLSLDELEWSGAALLVLLLS